ncbi:MAG TPA: YncE family protein, partial [Pyrinomonadaceae bacterium]|nr:YncE family protein [Pyrinomonadaceae bacterium]
MKQRRASICKAVSLLICCLGFLALTRTIQAQSVIATVPVGSHPYGVGVDPNPARNRIYVANETSGTVSVIDGATNTRIDADSITAGVNDISAGDGPYGLAVNPVTNRIFVNDRRGGVLLENFVTVIEGSSVGTTPVFTSFSLGQSQSAGITVNTTTNRVYVASQSFNTAGSFNTSKGAVTVIDGASTGVLPVIISQIEIPEPVTGIDVNTTTNKIYVSGTNNVFVIDGTTNAITKTILVGGGSFGVGVNETTNKIYVALNAAGTVKVIDGSTDTLTGTTITVGNQPQDVEVNTATNKIYVANGGSNTVSVIDGTSDMLVATFSLSLNFPAGVGVNETTNRVYVANQANDSVTVLGGLTAVREMRFSALRQGGPVLIQWQTGYEVNNLGFDLYREQKGKRTRINPSLIAGSALLTGAGTEMTAGNSYSWLDPSGTSDSKYYLEDIDLSGARTLHGPIVPIVSSSSIISDHQKQAMLLSELNAQAEAASGISKWQKGWPADTGAGRELLYDINDKSGVDIQHLIASKGAIKLSINKEGWYRVTQADLVAAGFNENVDARMLRLYSNGVEVPILMNAAKQQFSPGDSFEFYGAGLDTPTTDTNTYWLITGNGKGLRIAPQPRSAKPMQMTTSSVIQAQSQRGNGSQVLPSSPSTPRIPLSVSQPYPFNWIIVPTPAPAASKTENIKPENSKVTVPKAASLRDDSLSASTTAPPKKSRRSKARTKKGRRKVSLRNHAMLRPVVAQSYPYTVELREKIIYASSLTNGDAENFYGQAISVAPVSEKLYLSNLSQNYSGEAKL